MRWAWITLIVAAWLRFDFRGDLDLLDHLKSLPISASGGFDRPIAHSCADDDGVSSDHHRQRGAGARRLDFLMGAAAVLSLPFNALLFGVENLMFLIFPTRAAANPADFQGYGRQILMLFAKGVILVVAAGLAVLPREELHFMPVRCE